jgi:predicted RNase H-like HicB family nuclease
MKYAVVLERSDTGVGASIPDLPGCLAVRETEDEVRELIRAAVELHLEAMRHDGIAATGTVFTCRIHRCIQRRLSSSGVHRSPNPLSEQAVSVDDPAGML